jgi:prolyl-tRNA synthetase
MTHSDDLGLVLPPKLAPTQVVIVPIPKSDPDIDAAVHKIMAELKANNISVKYDQDDRKRPGFKFAEHEMKGIPVRLGVGKRDLENNQVEVARRDTGEKSSAAIDNIGQTIKSLLDDIQQNLYNKALQYRDAHITKVDSFDEFNAILDGKGGFVAAHWDGTVETEKKIKDLTKATIRCIPVGNQKEAGVCVLTGAPSEQRVLFARAY